MTSSPGHRRGAAPDDGRRARTSRSRLARAVTLVVLTVAVSLGAPVVASAQAPPASEPSGSSTPGGVGGPTSTQPTLPASAGRIIERPNTGVAPADSGDRGGSLQILLAAVLLGAVALIGLLVWRESRRGRARPDDRPGSR